MAFDFSGIEDDQTAQAPAATPTAKPTFDFSGIEDAKSEPQSKSASKFDFSGIEDAAKPATGKRLENGNIDLTNRPLVQTPEGVATVRSISINEDGKEVLIPTVSDDGKILSNQQAIDLYHQTGKHLGKFSDEPTATAYAQQLHEDQQALIEKGQQTRPASPFVRSLSKPPVAPAAAELLESSHAPAPGADILSTSHAPAEPSQPPFPKLGADIKSFLDRASNLVVNDLAIGGATQAYSGLTRLQGGRLKSETERPFTQTPSIGPASTPGQKPKGTFIGPGSKEYQKAEEPADSQSWRGQLDAASDVMEGLFKIGTVPFAVHGAVAIATADSPIAAAVGIARQLGLGAAAEETSKYALDAVGAPPEVTRFVSTIASLAAMTADPIVRAKSAAHIQATNDALGVLGFEPLSTGQPGTSLGGAPTDAEVRSAFEKRISALQEAAEKAKANEEKTGVKDPAAPGIAKIAELTQQSFDFLSKNPPSSWETVFHRVSQATGQPLKFQEPIEEPPIDQSAGTKLPSGEPPAPTESLATVPTTEPTPNAPGGAEAKVPFMVTKAMEESLKARGFDQAAIDKMTPEEAHAELAKPAPTDRVPPVTPLPPVASHLPPLEDTTGGGLLPPDAPRGAYVDKATGKVVLPSQEFLDDAKAREKDIRDKLKPFAGKSGLTKDEAKTYEGLMGELADLQFDRAKPLTLETVPANRDSTLAPAAVVAAQHDLLKDKGVYKAIIQAAIGTYDNADTPVDDILEGKNKDISADRLRSAFDGTREALRAQYGETVPAFRAEGQQKAKATQNWATTRSYAEQFGKNIIEKQIPVDAIAAVNVGLKGGYHELIVDRAKLAEHELAGNLAGAVKSRRASQAGLPEPRLNDRGNMEITFQKDPGAKAKDQLKRLGFNQNKETKVWWAKDNPDRREGLSIAPALKGVLHVPDVLASVGVTHVPTEAVSPKGQRIPARRQKRQQAGAGGSVPAPSGPDRVEARGLAAIPEREQIHFSGLLADARERGFTGTDDELADLFVARLADAKIVAKESASDDSEAESGRALLSTIARSGGIGIEAESESGFRGELEHLMESMVKASGVIRRGVKAGRMMPKGMTHKRGDVPGIKGIIVRKGGRPLDMLRESVQQEPAFADRFDSLPDFLEAIQDAIYVELGMIQSKADLSKIDNIMHSLFEVRVGSDWWKPVAEAPAEPEAPAAEPPDEDTSFDIDSFGEPERKYASTQLNLPAPLADKIRTLASHIPDEDLAANGREDNPHVTVQYGLHENEPGLVEGAVREHEPINLTLGKIKFFPDSGHGDVLYAEVLDNPTLSSLRSRIAASAAHTEEHPEYKPHVTIAYVQPGMGEQFAELLENDLRGQTALIGAVTFSPSEGESTPIALTPKSTGDGSLGDKVEKQRAAKAKMEAAIAAAKEAIAKGEPLNPGLSPELIKAATDFVQSADDLGITSAEDGWQQFHEAVGNKTPAMKQAFERAWAAVHGVSPTTLKQDDLLSTGESQPRLPGDVGAVRDLEVEQPKLADDTTPYSLASLQALGVFKPDQAVAINAIFQAAGLDASRLRIGRGVEPEGPHGGRMKSLFEQEDDRRLSVLHNLSSENLIHADKMGGLGVPSLAVVKNGMGLEGYGDITLIGRKHLGDPKDHDIYDADAYTATFPKPEYRRVKTSVAQKLVDEIRPWAAKFEDNRVKDEVWDNAVNTPKPHDSIWRMTQSNAVRAWFLHDTQGIDVEPVMQETPARFGWARMPTWLDFVKNGHWERDDLAWDDPERVRFMKDAATAAKEALGQYVEKQYGPEDEDAKETILDSFTRHHLDGDHLGYNTIHVAKRDAENKGKMRVSNTETQAVVDPLINGHEEALKSWVEDKILPMYGEPYLKLGRQKVPYTLQNAVDVMRSQPAKNAQDTMTFGEGKARAAAAHKISSVDEMKNRAEWQMSTKEDVEAKREVAKKAMSDWRDKIVDFYADGDTWRGLDASMRAISKAAKGLRESTLASALSREGFRNVPSRLLKQGVEAARLMMEAPVPYFEAKPMRVVKLGEFAGAVIPQNASPEVKVVLEKHGIPYREYEKRYNETDRGDAVKAFRDELSAKGEDVLFQQDPPLVSNDGAPIWRDTLYDAVTAWPQHKGTVDQLKAHLAKTKGTAEEGDWIGLPAFLKAQPTVTKSEVQRFIQANAVQLQEVEAPSKNAPDKLDIQAAKRAIHEANRNDPYHRVFILKHEDGDWYVHNAAGDIYPDSKLPDSIQEALKIVRAGGMQTKFGQYVQPGPTDGYHELILTLPRTGEAYTSSHFDDVPHYLSHVRFTDRTSADGKKTLFIEEIQSDRHIAGRKHGYYNPDKPYGVFDPRNPPATPLVAEFATEAEADAFLAAHPNASLDSVTPDILASEGSVPDAPFKKTWTTLAAKRMLKYAADHGYERVAWPTGAQVAELFSLSNHVDRIMYGYDDHHLAGWKNGNPVLTKTVKPEDLASYIGNEAAEKIRQAPVKKDSVGKVYRELSGVDLKVGGGWAKNLYDREFVNVMNELVKRHGGRVGTSDILSGKRDVRQGANDNEILIGKDIGTTVHSLDLTHHLTIAAKQPQPLFQTTKGTFQMGEDGTAVVRFFKSADFSTGIHEFGHYARATLFDRNLPPDARAGISDKDIEITEKFCGVGPDGKWTRENEEVFARGLERVILDNAWGSEWGQGGSKRGTAIEIPWDMRQVFGKAANWMAAIYKNVAASPIAKDISDDMREVFGRLLTRAERLKAMGLATTPEEPAAKVQEPDKGALPREDIARRNKAPKTMDLFGNDQERLFQAAPKTDSPEFKAWFGASKIVDANGQPQVVYHGTRAGGQIEGLKPSTGGEFGPGIYLTPDSGGAGMAANRARGEGGAAILPVYAAIQKPFRVTKQDWIKLTENRTPSEVQARLQKQGYDGIVGTGISGAEQQIVAFKPTQIKSATGNTGEYSQTNPNILHQTVEPEDLKPEDAKAIVKSVKDSIAKGQPFEKAVQAFEASYGPSARDFDEYLETAWEHLTGQPVSAKNVPSVSESGTTLQSGLIPGASEFVEQDVVPSLKQAATDVSDARNDIKALFSPASVNANARDFANIVRANTSARDQKIERAHRVLKNLEKAFDKRLQGAKTPEAKAAVLLEFVDPIENGTTASLPPDLAKAASVLSDLLRGRREKVQELGRLETFIENYFPHEWEDPNKVTQVLRRLLGKKPLQGSKAFLKKRSIPTTREGIDMGFVPVSYNPVDLVFRKLVDMDKFITATEILLEGKSQGLAKYVPVGKQPPDGWKRFDHSFATVYGKPTVDVKNEAGELEEKSLGGLLIRGYYYGPPEVVRLIDNHLSAGLRGYSAFNLYRRVGNFMNQVQLGLSAFHLTMTGMESIISKQSMAFELLSRGEVGEALRKQLEVPVAPLADLVRGHQALKKFYEKDANAQAIDDVVSMVVQGGGGFGWSLFEHEGAPAQFMKALRQGNYPGALLRGVPALVELQAKPIMEGWVPRLKMAAFLDLMRMEMKTLGPNPDLAEVRRIAASAWDSIDNRFGQLRYDNLFWHNALKDLGMATFRALGWNIGSVAEAGGALFAQLRQAGLIKGGGASQPHAGIRPVRMMNVGVDKKGNPVYEQAKEPWLSHKLSWLIATILVYGLAGAIYQYLHTGKGPKELKDYYFPHNSEGTRVSIPGYPKDWYAFATDPIMTVVHKINPLPALLATIWSNEDYFGTALRNPDDPIAAQAKDLMEAIAKSFQPMSVKNFTNLITKSAGGAIESFFGINKAPASVSRTAAEDMIHKFNPPQPKTQQQADQADLRRQIRQGTAAGDQSQVDAAKQTGRLSQRQIENAIKAAHATYLQNGVKSLTLAQALQVYEVATPDERTSIYQELMAKRDRGIANAPTQQQSWLKARAAKVLALPRAEVVH